MLPLLRQRSREAVVGGGDAAAAPPPSKCAPELALCAAARRAKDPCACLQAALSALRKDEACGKAWFFLCWARFELRQYEKARADCRRALAHRSWALRDREGMAALRTSCLLLMELTPACGEKLRDGWYMKRLRALYEAGELHEHKVTVLGGWEQYHAGGPDELSLLDDVPALGLDDVRLGGDGAERDVPRGLLVGGDPNHRRKPMITCRGGPNFPAEQGLGGVVYLKSTILPFHCDKRFGPIDELDEDGGRTGCYAPRPESVGPDGRVKKARWGGPCKGCIRQGFPVPKHRFPTWNPVLPAGASLTRPHAQVRALNYNHRALNYNHRARNYNHRGRTRRCEIAVYYFPEPSLNLP